YWQAAQLFEYSFNFFFDSSLPKINYQDLYNKCKELIKMKLPDLPTSPDLILISIKIKLPKAIPITSPKYTREIVQCLRAYYNFDLLFPSYFIKRSNLPENPFHLKVEVQDIFPLTKRADLRAFQTLVDKLREHYYVPNKLPELYFCFLSPKEPLPLFYKDLPKNMIGYFPVSNNVADIKEAVQILRNESYTLKKLPADYIITKRPFPPVH
ncbi:11851_t:CDS:1, partial [Acaulospora colombiana]